MLDGANIDFITPGTFISKAATHTWAGGASGNANLPALPAGLAGQLTKTLALTYRYRDLKPVVGASYLVRFVDGSSKSGVLDASGNASLENPPGAGQVFFGFDSRAAHLRRDNEANAVQGASPATPEAAQQTLERYLAAEDEFLKDNFFPDEVTDDGTASSYEDQVNDYEYRAELVPPEESEGPPGSHDEQLLSDTSGAST